MQRMLFTSCLVESLLQIANDPDGMAVLDVLQPGLHGLDVVEDSLYGEIRMLLEHSNVNMTAEFLWYNYMRD